MLQAILNIPREPSDWLHWGHDHRIHHQIVAQAMQSKRKIFIQDFPIYPITKESVRDFLLNNSQLHININNALQTPSVNLQDVDFNNENETIAWVYDHFLEHRSWAQTLGIEGA